MSSGDSWRPKPPDSGGLERVSREISPRFYCVMIRWVAPGFVLLIVLGLLFYYLSLPPGYFNFAAKILVGFCLSFAGLIFLAARKLTNRDRDLLINGEFVKAKIERVRAGTRRIDSDGRVHFIDQAVGGFVNLVGFEVEGVKYYSPIPDMSFSYREGDELIVFFDRLNPERATVYPSLYWKLAV